MGRKSGCIGFLREQKKYPSISSSLSLAQLVSGSEALAAVDGDFIVTALEVQPVLRALRKAGIHIVALHNHMIGEQPAFMFLHFWGKGSTQELAAGIKAALDAQKGAAAQSTAH